MEQFEIHRSRIKTWILNSYETKSYLKFDDLHINQISTNFEKKLSWINGIYTCWQNAIKVRDSYKIPLIIGASIPIQVQSIEDICLTSESELFGILDETPPSLYLFSPEQEAWLDLKQNSTIASDLSIYFKENIFYYSHCHGNSEATVSIWFFSEPIFKK